MPDPGIRVKRDSEVSVMYAEGLDIIANNPIDQKVADLSSSQHYSLVENAMYRFVFPPLRSIEGCFPTIKSKSIRSFCLP